MGIERITPSDAEFIAEAGLGDKVYDEGYSTTDITRFSTWPRVAQYGTMGTLAYGTGHLFATVYNIRTESDWSEPLTGLVTIGLVPLLTGIGYTINKYSKQ